METLLRTGRGVYFLMISTIIDLSPLLVNDGKKKKIDKRGEITTFASFLKDYASVLERRGGGGRKLQMNCGD